MIFYSYLLKKFFAAYSLIIIVSLNFQANAKNPVRTEIDISDISGEVHVVVADSNGFICFYKTADKAMLSSGNKWHFKKYDTSMHLNWYQNLTLEKRMHVVDYYNDKKNIFILLFEEKKYQILKLNINNGTITVINGKTSNKYSSINDFSVINEFAYFGGSLPPSKKETCFKSCLGSVFLPLLFMSDYLPKRNAVIYNMNMFSSMGKEIPVKTKSFSEVIDIEPEHKNITFEILIKKNPAGEEDMLVAKYNHKGIRINKIPLVPDKEDRNLINARIAILNKNKKIVTGTYSLKNAGAQGIFFVKIINNKAGEIKYYPFTNFYHFFDYMSKGKQKKIRDKIDKKREKDKNLKLDYNFLLHEIKKRDSLFILIGEAYYKEYQTQYRTTYMSGMPVTRPVEVFRGYRFTHAIAVAFDKSGNLKWEISISLNHILQNELKKNAALVKDSGKYTIAYHENGKINYRIFDDYDVFHSQSKKKITKLYKNDEVLVNNSYPLRAWYGPYFLTFGKQKIKNNLHKGNRKRTVLYLTKERIIPKSDTIPEMKEKVPDD